MSEQQIIRNGESYDLGTHECGECRYFNKCPCGECLWGVCINTYSRDYGEYVSAGASACDCYRRLYE